MTKRNPALAVEEMPISVNRFALCVFVCLFSGL
jgi:hypothetical protein